VFLERLLFSAFYTASYYQVSFSICLENVSSTTAQEITSKLAWVFISHFILSPPFITKSAYFAHIYS